MFVYPNTHDYHTASTPTANFDIKQANPAFMEKWLHLAIRRFTELEAANILRYAFSINLCQTKEEKLRLAYDVASKITPWLWDQPHPYRKEAHVLARKMENLQGLMSIIKLAGVR
jgi:hypothetical protein